MKSSLIYKHEENQQNPWVPRKHIQWEYFRYLQTGRDELRQMLRAYHRWVLFAIAFRRGYATCPESS